MENWKDGSLKKNYYICLNWIKAECQLFLYSWYIKYPMPIDKLKISSGFFINTVIQGMRLSLRYLSVYDTINFLSGFGNSQCRSANLIWIVVNSYSGPQWHRLIIARKKREKKIEYKMDKVLPTKRRNYRQCEINVA